MTLEEFFLEHPRAALACSGGADSAYLLAAACALRADVRPYFVRTPLQPASALSDARRLARALCVPLSVLEVPILEEEGVRTNAPERCYLCKKRMLSAVQAAAAADGYGVLLDGTNASDEADDRPGMRALTELSVLSPLRLCGLRKAGIRRLSREMGLFTWDKPAEACLATRFPAGTALTPGRLRTAEAAEAAVYALGYRDFRVRIRPDALWLELPEAQHPRALREWGALSRSLQKFFPARTLFLKVR